MRMKKNIDPSNRTRVNTDAGVLFLHTADHAVWPIWHTDHVKMWCSQCGCWIEKAARPVTPLPLFDKDQR